MTFSMKFVARSLLNKTIETISPKKLNNSFVVKILKNDAFKSVLSLFLNEHIIRESIEENDGKLYKLCLSWQVLVFSKNLSQFEQVCKAIEADSKNKLPWTVSEISKAIEFFFSQFGK